MVQWLRLCTPNAGDPGSILGQGTRSHMLQLRPGTAKLINIKKKKESPFIVSCCLLLPILQLETVDLDGWKIFSTEIPKLL